MEKIDPRHLLIKIAGILERLNIPYIITGGMAVLVWGRPRFTADIDIVVELEQKNLPALEKALRELSDGGYVDYEMMKDALQREGEFNFVDGETGVKVDFWILKQDDFDKSRIKHRVEKEVLGKKIYFTTAEDLILIKLKWYKESESSRQKEDVESIFKISGEKLDMSYINSWAVKLELTDTLKEIIK